MSGTAAAGLERDGGGFLRGLEREMRSLSVVGIRRGIAYSENAPLAYCILWPAFGRAMRRHNAKRNRTMKRSNELNAIDIAAVQSRMLTIRNQQVLLDRDVAALYGVETKALNQAVKRNAERFDEGYIFQLDTHELENWKSQIVTSNLSKEEIAGLKMGLRRAPYAFTERGLYMLATVLNSDRAVHATKAIIETYAQVRSMVRDMEALQTEKAGSPEQANMLTRAGHKLASLIGDNLSTVSRKTTIELNLALLKISHEVTERKE